MICRRECGRVLVGKATWKALIRTPAAPILPPEHFCRDCARPISEEGRRRADNAGFLRLAQAVSGRRQAIPTSAAGVVD